MSDSEREKDRRGRGEGSIVEVRPGRWMARVTVAPGKRRTLYGKTRNETLSAMRQALTKAERGEPVPDGRLTVETFLREWLEGPAKSTLRDSTWAAYRHYVEAHIIPEIGAVRLAKLKPADVEAMLAKRQIAAEGRRALSARTCQQLRAILRSALAWGERNERVSRNVAAIARGPRAERTEIRPLTVQQARQLVEAAPSDPLGALYVLAIDTGMRQGELLGLRWADVDMDGHKLRVEQSRVALPGATRFSAPKTATSRRSLKFTTLASSLLRAERARQAEYRLAAGKRWRDHGLVFTDAQGEALNGSTVTHAFQRFLARNGLPRQRFHDLRHASASIMLAQGIPIKAVSDRLGHSTVSTTMNIYAHLADEMQGLAADRMQDALSGNA